MGKKSQDENLADQGIVAATNRSANETIAGYSENQWLTSLIAQFPILGAPINSMLTSRGMKFIRERLESMIREVHVRADKLDKEKVDVSYLESEKFFDLLRKVIEESTKTRHDEKIKLYAKILCNSADKDLNQDHDPELYLSIISELTIEEIFALSGLYDIQKHGPSPGEKIVEFEKRCSWRQLVSKSDRSEEDWRFILRRLERTGLVAQLTGYVDTMDADGHFVITPALNKMMDFLVDFS